MPLSNKNPSVNNNHQALSKLTLSLLSKASTMHTPSLGFSIWNNLPYVILVHLGLGVRWNLSCIITTLTRIPCLPLWKQVNDRTPMLSCVGFQLKMSGSLLEKRFIVTPAIHFWYGLITVVDTKNELLFFVSADLINRYKKYYFSYRLT
jgi:hypothetical protein